MSLPPTGFQSKTYEEILQSIKSRLAANLTSPVEITDTSSLGKLAAIYARELEKVYTFSSGVADSYNLDNAVGKSLDDHGSLTGNFRGFGSPANGNVHLTSSYTQLAYTIPSGTLFSSEETSKQYSLDTDISVDRESCISITKRIPTGVADQGVYPVYINDVLYFALSQQDTPTPEYMLQILADTINGNIVQGSAWIQLTMKYFGTPYSVPFGTPFKGALSDNIYELGNTTIDNTDCNAVKVNLSTAVLNTPYSVTVGVTPYSYTIAGGPISPLLILTQLAILISAGEPTVTATVVSNNDMIIELDDPEAVFSVTSTSFDMVFTEVTARASVTTYNNTQPSLGAGKVTEPVGNIPNFISVRNDTAFTMTPITGSVIATASLPSTSTILVESNDRVTSLKFDTQDHPAFPVVQVESLGAVSQTDNDAELVPANTIDTLVTPVEGLLSVINEQALATGNPPETDTLYRKSLKSSQSIIGGATVSALSSKLNNLENVSYALVRENDTSVTDSEGLPPFSLRATVEGGSSEEIGQLIWDFKTAGTSSEGSQSVSIIDAQGLPRVVNYERPNGIPIVIDITATLDPERGLPTANLEEVVRGLIGTYASTTYKIGKDVIQYEFYVPIYAETSGYTFSSITISAPASIPLHTVNASGVIEILGSERATFDPEDITVTIV